MPIVVNGQIVGAIGVSGVTSQQDAQIGAGRGRFAEVRDAGRTPWPMTGGSCPRPRARI